MAAVNIKAALCVVKTNGVVVELAPGLQDVDDEVAAAISPHQLAPDVVEIVISEPAMVPEPKTRKK